MSDERGAFALVDLFCDLCEGCSHPEENSESRDHAS